MQWCLSKDGGEAGHETDGAPAIVEEPAQVCAFCRGKGEKPAGSQCSVCRGKGRVEIRPPAVKCALCKGRGEERPRGNVTCNACRGKGYVTVTPPMQKGGSCRGTGRQRGSLLACITCHGAGVVSISPQKTQAVASSRPGPAARPAFTFRIGEQPLSTGGRRATVPGTAARRMQASSAAVAGTPTVLANELEILRLYARAFLTGERIILTDAARRTPAYTKLLKESLIKKGLLRPNGWRKLEITDRGLQVVRKRGRVEAAGHGSHPAARGAEKADEGDATPTDPAKAVVPAQAPAASNDNGLQWSALRGA